MNKIFCKNCNARLDKYHTMYYNDNCKREYYKKINAEDIIHVCNCCSSTYVARTAKQRYCSAECANKSNKRHYDLPPAQFVWDVVDCLPSTDIATLNRMLRDRSFNINMLIRKVIKLKLEMQRKVARV